jgi:pimeloyl-ACP methyl ester carboxylesterase
MGGLVGIALGGLQDSPLQALVLNDIGPSIAEQGLRRIAGGLARRMRFASLDEAADYLWSVSEGFGPHSRADWLELCRPMLVQQSDGSLLLHYDPGILQSFAQLGAPDAAAQLAAGEQAMWALYDAVKAPTLVLRGEHSDILSPGTTQAMRARGPQARSLEIPGVGHAPTLMSPEQIEPVQRFLLDHLAAA